MTANAAYWVSSPNSCPQTDGVNYPGVNCFPEYICGDSSGTPQCYDTTTLTPPATSATSNTQYTASLGGGYIIDCYASADAGAPYCDNAGAFWCNRDASCYSTQYRDTTCTANVWATFTCGNCRSGYQDCGGDSVCEVETGVTNYPVGSNNNYGAACTAQCDAGYVDCNSSGAGAGDGCEVEAGVTNYPTGANNHYTAACIAECDSGYLDCDGGGAGTGNGCEVQDGASCTLGGLTGVINGCSGGAANCVVDPQYFETGTEAEYSTSNPLLWGTQYGSGDLMSLGNNTTANLFSVENDGAVEMAQITAPTTTTNKLYNVAGTLYWDGSPVGGAGAAHTQNTDTGTTSADFNINSGADTDSSITFGQTLGAVISYVVGSSWFNFNDDVNIQGNLTTTGTINGVTVGNTNQSIILEPEYDKATYVTTGTNRGKLEMDYEDADGVAGNNNYNYYKWTTQQAGLQEVEIVVRAKLPEGFNSWQATPIQLLYKTNDANAANNVLNVTVEDSAGAAVSLTGASNLVSASWATAGITFGGTPTWTAGSEITIKVKLQATSSGAAFAGRLFLNYNGS